MAFLWLVNGGDPNYFLVLGDLKSPKKCCGTPSKWPFDSSKLKLPSPKER